MVKLAFFGTPEFSLPALEAVISYAQSHGHEFNFVVTQPDARQGRGKMLAPPAVKKKALEYKLRILQPQSLRKNTEDGDIFIKILLMLK